ncbi:lytic transglycosylase [Pyruvatibacter mobilis]|nr:lytic transglycosylase [Pyruvatibacter mobilis]
MTFGRRTALTSLILAPSRDTRMASFVARARTMARATDLEARRQREAARLRMAVTTALVALALLISAFTNIARADTVAPVLSDADRTAYARIFRAQEAGDWKTADRLIDGLEDDVLMGHVLFQRYMHPTAYRSRYAELKTWLARYADHPGADKIHKLALKRRGGSAAPMRPVRRAYRPTAYHSVYAVAGSSAEGRTSYGRTIARKVRSLISRERPTQALGLLESAKVRNRLGADERAALMARIAWSYYVEGKITKAFAIASGVAESHRRDAPLADWYAGLAAWRLGDVAAANTHFDALAGNVGVSDWTRGAGAFWAARTALKLRDPAGAVAHLETAAATGMTFYGLLAQRQLGRTLQVEWSDPVTDVASHSALLQIDQVRRGAALAELGMRDLAEAELRRAHGRLDPSLDRALAALARDLDLPATQLAVALASPQPIGAALFPVPDIKPEGGFQVDRALLLAVARQESKFISGATSRAGAAGLMQIMPGTAYHITRDASYRRNRDRLQDPAHNLALGQTYLQELMNYGEPYGNLFHMAVAYNAGPGNLNRWLKQIGPAAQDPLTFIESIPAAETRGYVERIMTNLWLYRLRLGQPSPSLDQAASGDWPVYAPVERAGVTLQNASRL